MESSQIRHPDNLALLSSLSSEMSSMTILWSCGDDDGGDGDGQFEGAASTTLGKFALQRATFSAQARPLEKRLALPTTR